MNQLPNLQHLQARLIPLRESLLNHPIYRQIQQLESLHLFMQHHVFAVWDFMSLLKKMQQQICGTDAPWFVPKDPLAARFVNEIVLGEESDEDGSGGFASHFELYHRSMQECGAKTDQIDAFLYLLQTGHSIESALTQAKTPESVSQFVLTTFEIIAENDICAVASSFTFGREDLLPDVFQCIVDQLNSDSGGHLDSFQYYLQRHIELDGDHHGPMASRLMISLCGNDDTKWQAAESAAIRSLTARLKLWDGMQLAMQNDSPRSSPAINRPHLSISRANNQTSRLQSG